MTRSGAESLDARLVRFRSRSGAEDAGPLAKELRAARRFAEAAEVLEVVAMQQPTSYEAWIAVARCREEDADTALAQRAWLEVARRFPKREEPYVAIADLLIARRDFDRARRILERGVAMVGTSMAFTERSARIDAADVAGLADTADVAKPAASSIATDASDEGEAVEPDDDPDSTIIASRKEVEALRSLGALLPGAPPTPHRGAPWEDAGDSSSGAKLRFPAETTSVRDRGDATVPFSTVPRPTVSAPPPPPPSRGSSTPPAPPSREASAPTPRSPVATAASSRPVPAAASAASSAPAVGSPVAAAPSAPASAPPVVAVSAPRTTPAPTVAPREAGRVESRRVSSPEATHPSPGRGRSALRVVLVASSLLGLGVAIGFGVTAYTERTAAGRLASQESQLLAADSQAIAAMLDDGDVLREATRTEHRDLRLEAVLLEAMEVGGVPVSALRAALVGARARGTSADWISLADAVIAWVAGDRTRAEHALGAPDARASRTLVVVRARLEAALGRRREARAMLASIPAPVPVAVSVALAELDRDDGDTAAAKRRLVQVMAVNPSHLRANAWLASIALDAGEAPDAPLVQAIRSAARSPAIGDRALVASVLARIAGRVDPEFESLARTDAPFAPAIEVELATALGLAGPSSLALERLTRAVGETPTSPRARRVRAHLLSSLGRIDEASSLVGDDPSMLPVRIEAAMASSTEARSVVAAIAALGDDAPVELRAKALRLRIVAGDDPTVVLANAIALADAHPMDRDAYLAKVAIAASAGRWDLVVPAPGAESDTGAELLSYLALASLRSGDIESLVARRDRLVAIAPDAPATVAVDARTRLETLDLEGARTRFEALAARSCIVAEGTCHGVGVAGLVLVSLATADLDAARNAASTLREADLGAPFVTLAAARLALADGRHAEAIAMLDGPANRPAASPAFLATYGDALVESDDTDRATEAFRAAIAVDSGNPEAQLGLAAIFVRAGLVREASTQLVRARRALDARRRGPSVESRYFVLLGRNLLAQREVEEARFALRRSVETDAAAPEAYFFLGESLAGANSPDARAAYEQYLRLAPNGPYASRARRNLP